MAKAPLQSAMWQSMVRRLAISPPQKYAMKKWNIDESAISTSAPLQEESEEEKNYPKLSGKKPLIIMDMDPEDVIYEKFKDLTSNENLTKVAENVNAGATKTFRYVALVIFFLFIVVGILISFFIRSEFKHRVEVERSEASVSSQMAERESEFNEEYDRISEQIESQRDNLTGDS